ncbi:MAG: IgA Peptidase M64 [Bacteroidetes bacterium]|nr:IgA Peptidase M64 [Bacteroidota bacterium]MCL1968975.1 IgA Peptidase M64 [Bacteroidota bacterium]
MKHHQSFIFRNRLRLLLSVFCFLPLLLSAQNFNTYFENKTLRIDYMHQGNAHSEKIAQVIFWRGGIWSGTHTQLIEPARLGEMVLTVKDAKTNEIIYTRSYSTLFGEYATTERAEKEEGFFEESILMPYPKAPVKYEFGVYSRSHQFTFLYEGEFDPKTTPQKPFKKKYNVMNLHIGGKAESCLDILFLPDGYSKKDKEKLKKDMQTFADYILNCSPYSENKDKVNIRAIKGYSKESGITDPNAKVFKKTLLNSSYNTIDVDRYLMCLNVWKMNEIADDAPYDALLIIANSKKYGGGGIYNFYAVVNSDGKYSDYVTVHELGHSIAGLGDEYFDSEVSVRDFYPEGVEPVEPNLTTLVDFDKKWKHLLAQDTPVPTPDEDEYNNVVGVFEGGGYVAKGVYRPWHNCTMKEKVYNGFCPVCKKALENVFLYFSK